MNSVHLIIGVPGSGKTWVCEQLDGKGFHYVAHDNYIKGNYIGALHDAARFQTCPILAEAPFSITAIKEPLERFGIWVNPVFVLTPENELHRRWHERGNVEEKTKNGHISRQHTYRQRALEYRAFSGTADEVLKYLKESHHGR